MWNAGLGGLPSEEFLTSLDPLLAGVRSQLNGRYETSDHIAGHLSPEWADKLGLRAGIPIPVGAFDAHWDAIGAGVELGDVVNVVGTSTCIIAISRKAGLIPGVCGVVEGSVDPQCTGIEAGLSATGDIFEAIARRAGTTVAELSRGLEAYQRRRDRSAPPHLGQRRSHRAGESRTQRRSRSAGVSPTPRRTNCSPRSRAPHSTRA